MTANKYIIAYNALPSLSYIDSLSGPIKFNIEKMLLEIINKTKFKDYYGNSEFFKLRNKDEQSNSEDDFYNDYYSGDFKRFMSSSYGHAKSELSHRLLKLSSGIGMVSSRRTGTMKAVNILEVLKDKTTDEINEILNKKPKDIIGEEVEIFCKILGKKKNIVFFIPFMFWIDEEIDEEKEIEYICNEIITSQIGWIQFRYEMVYDKDVFFILPIINYFVVIKINFAILPLFEIIDKINCEKVDLYQRALLHL